jgi:hypothetical protein
MTLFWRRNLILSLNPEPAMKTVWVGGLLFSNPFNTPFQNI